MDVNTPTYGVTSTAAILFGRPRSASAGLCSGNLHDRYASPAPRHLKTIAQRLVKRNKGSRIGHRRVIDGDASLLDQAKGFAL